LFLTSISRDRGSMVRCRGIWVDSSSIIGHISNIASIAISLVSNMLGTAIRKGNRVRSLSITSTITSLGSVEVGVRVVIRDSISIGIRGGLIGVSRGVVGRGSVDNRGVVGRGSVDHRGVVGRGSMDHRGVVGRGSMDHRSSMVDSVDHRGSMVDSVNNRGSMVDSMDKRGSMVDSMCYRSSMSHNSMRSSMVTS